MSVSWSSRLGAFGPIKTHQRIGGQKRASGADSLTSGMLSPALLPGTILAWKVDADRVTVSPFAELVLLVPQSSADVHGDLDPFVP